MMTGWATAVLVETVMLPFESVEVTGTRIATGLVGSVVVGVGKGAMSMFLDAGAGTTGSKSLAGPGPVVAAFPAGPVVVVGTR